MRAREQAELEYRATSISDELRDLRTLGEVCRIERGVEFSLSLQANRARLVSDCQKTGFVPGVWRKDQLTHAFRIGSTGWINLSSDGIRAGGKEVPWERPKVIVRMRGGQGPWRLIAAVDDHGVACYRDFCCLWPTAGWSRECVAAVLNGPVANNHLKRQGHRADDLPEILGTIPLPELDGRDRDPLTHCVREYLGAAGEGEGRFSPARLEQQLQRIDVIVLNGYDLPPQAERDLLDSFAQYQRPVPFEFTCFYEEGFRAAVPYSIYIGQAFQRSTAERIERRMPVIADEEIHAAMQTARRLDVEGARTEHE